MNRLSTNYREKLCGGKGRPVFDAGYNVASAALAGWLYDGLSMTRRAARTAARVFARYNEELDTAEAVASAVYLGRIGSSKDDIRKYVEKNFGYNLPVPLTDPFPVSPPLAYCQDAATQAIAVFLAANSFEDTIRLSERCGGSFGARSAIAGVITEAYYGIPEELEAECLRLLPDKLLKEHKEFTVIRKNRLSRQSGESTQRKE